MSQSLNLSSILCGVAGEYFVAAELSRRGYVASVTLRNTCGIDILASNVDATSGRNPSQVNARWDGRVDPEQARGGDTGG
jgi:hypothetical protein